MPLTSCVRCLSIDKKFCLKIRMIDPDKITDDMACNASIHFSCIVIFVGVLSIDNVKKYFVKY